ncbi:MAG TPA: hypothetical protein GXX72_04435 [Clostridiaceae bacterium]|nr:hypothetical protein [Clostridiaceae bacterium]
MTTEYVKMAKAARRGVSRLTLRQQLQILQIYGDAIQYLSEKAEGAGQESLTRRWALDYASELAIERIRLQKRLERSIKSNIGKASGYGVQFDLQMFSILAERLGISERFKDVFSQIPLETVRPIMSGELYKDKRSLSERIWCLGDELEKDMQYIVNRGLIEHKSAVELAKDLEQYVKEPAKRPTTWGKAYPNLRNKKVDYNAMRLARTSINHAYQTASIRSAERNPFVEGIEWHSALQHGRTCELCAQRHGQVFPKDDVPLDHPNGLCTMIPYIPKSLDQVADELRGWLGGGENERLDEWYKKYGHYYATKGVG